MKIKELQKSVNVAWSPEKQDRILLAAGSAAQQLLDTSFNSSNPLLELYSLNLSDTSYDLELVGTQHSDHKFHKLVWAPFDNSNQYSNGLIVGGCESGYLKIYNVSKILAGEDALVAQSNKHTGPVRTLDYNPFKSNLIASATSESEIFIWDVNNTSVPMTPGQKTQPLEDVCGVAWNLQVQHILASTFATRCVVWDLRKNEPIIKLSDSQSRVRWRAVNWHPDIATQLWLASEDDQTPVIQLWDLRYATAPSKTLQIHSRGVLGMALCPKDTELMISCAKDNKILCWNTSSEDNHGEILSEIASTSSWYSDITWCPKNPALVAASSFDGNVSIYSLFGGAQQQVQTSNKIADSFPGMESIPQEHSSQTAAHAQIFHDLKRPPKWFKRPSGISFGFGGKFVTFNGTNKTVEIKQLITDENLVKKSTELENVLTQGNYVDYCRKKADDSNDQHKRYIWYFLKAYFEENPTSEFLNLLGYHTEDVVSKFSKFVDDKDSSNNIDGVTNQMAQLNRNQDEMNGINDSSAGKIPYKLSTTGSEGLICEALLTGNIASAVELCMNAGRSTDAIILASLGGSDLLAKTQYRYLKNNDSFISNLISAMVMADWSGVISQCTIDSWKEALVAALTHSKDQSNLLCERLGERMQMESGGDLSIVQDSILCYICAGNIERIVDAWCTINGHDSLDDSGKLQELIEIVILLNKGMERHGQNIPVYGRYAELLSKYASLLAAQGSLEMALTYVGTSCDDAHIVDLRERLYYALGHKNQSSGMQQQRQRTISGFGQNYQTGPRLSHPRTVSTSSTGMTANNFNTGLPNSSTNVMPPTTFNTGLPNSGLTNNYVDPMSQMWSQPSIQPPQLQPVPKPPTFMNPLDNIPQPPRPSSVSSVSSQTNTASSGPPKPKRLLDPSVQSNTGYGQIPPSVPYNPNNQQFNTNPIQPAFNTQPINSMPLQTQPQMMQPSWDQQNVYGYQNNAMNGNLAPPPMSQVLKNPTPPPGWNDPPEFKPKSQFVSTKSDMSAVHAGTKKWLQKHSDGYSNSSCTSSSEPKKDMSVAAPIMHPIFGASDPNQVPPANNMMNPNVMPGQNQYDQSYGTAQQPTQMQPNAPMSTMNPTNFYQPQQQQQQQQMQDNSNMINYQNFNSFVGAPQQQQQQEMPVQPPVQEVVKEKPPLPEEFIYLQTVLEELKSQCINRATNPQMKRKLDDVSRRLESLYDLLRDNRLSTNTLESLNQMVQLIQIGDYANCLGLHTQMVSGPEFAKIATFMPGMKILIQLAIQLQVFLR